MNSFGARRIRPRVVVVELGLSSQRISTQLQRGISVPWEPIDHDIRVQCHPVNAAAMRVYPHQARLVTFGDRFDALGVMV